MIKHVDLFVKRGKTIYRYISVRNRSFLLSYGLAVSSVLFALLIHIQFAHFVWNASPFLMFLPAVILTSWYGGFLPGFVSTIVATFVGDYFFLTPQYTLIVSSNADAIRLLLFFTVSVLICVINQSFYNQKEEKERILLELEENESKFRRIANSAPVMLWILDDKLSMTFANNTLLEFLGDKRSWIISVHPDDLVNVKKNCVKSI